MRPVADGCPGKHASVTTERPPRQSTPCDQAVCFGLVPVPRLAQTNGLSSTRAVPAPREQEEWPNGSVEKVSHRPEFLAAVSMTLTPQSDFIKERWGGETAPALNDNQICSPTVRSIQPIGFLHRPAEASAGPGPD